MPTSDILITSAAVEYQFDSNRSICIAIHNGSSDYYHVHAQASMHYQKCDKG